MLNSGYVTKVLFEEQRQIDEMLLLFKPARKETETTKTGYEEKSGLA